MKRLLKIAALLLALLGGLLVIGGWLLNPVYRVERSLVIAASPELVYRHLDSSEGWRRWGVWFHRDPQLELQRSGAEQGAGAAWSWRSASQGNGSMRLTETEVPHRVAYELRIDDWAPSSGELRLAAEGQGTRVIWLMQGDVGGNPLNRWLVLFIDRLVGPDFEEGLNNLKSLAEQGR